VRNSASEHVFSMLNGGFGEGRKEYKE